ncbi:MAG TPA: hypothetical protein VKH82_04050 [Candidatus Binatia bacterium]|nr:hypothetical protein [Candidatus Binatia bacterium]
MECREDEQVVERAIAGDRAQRRQILRAERRGRLVRTPYEADERALERRRVGERSCQQRRNAPGVSSCSLQEALVGVDSVVAVVQP